MDRLENSILTEIQTTPILDRCFDWCAGSLLPARFVAARGLFREHGGIQLVITSSAREGSESVDLSVRIDAVRSVCTVPTSTDLRQNKAVQVLWHDLHSRNSQIRATACQALGQLADEVVLPELFRLASEDDDIFVRQVASEATERVVTAKGSQISGANLELVLRYSVAGQGITILGPIRTDGNGAVRFEAVPSEADCELGFPQPVRRERCEMPTDEAWALLENLEFSDEDPVVRSRGSQSAGVQPFRFGQTNTYAALLWLRPALDHGVDTSQPGVAVRRGSEYWAPSVVQMSTGWRWFHRLPHGRFVTHLAREWFPPEMQRSWLYALSDSTASRGPVRESVGDHQIVHPTDERLLVMIERDHHNAVVMTVESEANELKNARFQFVLGTERGEFQFSDFWDQSRYRATLRLEQEYQGDEAARLSIQVIPYSLSS